VRSLATTLCASAIAAAFLGSAGAADLPSIKPSTPPPTIGPTSCTDPVQFVTTDCALSWYGITFYGTVDLGVGWESHGVPLNNSIISGVEELVQKNSNRPLWLLTPGGLQQSFIGLKGREEFAPGWSFVFDVSMGFDPYTMTLANGPKSYFQNNGVALPFQTSNADSSRAGQFYNGAGYAGISNSTFGTLTAGRVNSLSLDGVIAYDPMGASYAFSPIGWSGLTAGVGDTEDARYTTAIKYRVDVGMFRASALYQFGGYDLNNGTQSAYEVGFGGDVDLGAYGKLSLDAIYSDDKGAVSSAPLTAAQDRKYPGTLAATISDDSGVMLLAKYVYNQVKVYSGYEYIKFQNPSNPQLTAFTDIAGYTVVAANINNTAYPNHRIQQVMWIGARYAFTDTFNVGVGLYHYIQDSYALKYCNNISLSSCAGTLNAVSFDADWQFAKKFDAYAGVMYSEVHNGLASGYLHPNNLAPTVGMRFRF
jgi:predicted porin